MSGQPVFSKGVREDLIDCMEKSYSVSQEWLRDVIISIIEEVESQGKYASMDRNDLPEKNQVMAMKKEALVGEAVDLVEQNFNGKSFSIDPEGRFTIDLDTLKKEREIVEHKEKVEEYNGMMALGISVGENIKFTETKEFLRSQNIEGDKGKEEKLLPDPCKTPNGAFISMSARGISISNASGEHLSNLKEGFENIGTQLPGLRAEALKSEPSNEKKRDLDVGMSMR